MDLSRIIYQETGTGLPEQYDFGELLKPNIGEVANSNNIGVEGTSWLGQGWIDPVFVPGFLREMDGTRKTDNPEFGNYQDLNGGIWVCLPHSKFRRKPETGALEFSSVEPTDVFYQHPAFIVNGEFRHAIFVMKYPASYRKIGGTNTIISELGKPPLHAYRIDTSDDYSFSVMAGGTITSITELNNFLPVQNELCPMTIYANGLIATISNLVRNTVPASKVGFMLNAYPVPVSNFNTYSGLFASDPVMGYTGMNNRLKQSTHNGQACGISDINTMYFYLIGLRQMTTTYGMFNVSSYDIRSAWNNLATYVSMTTDAQLGYGYLGYRVSGTNEFYDPATSIPYWLAAGANLPRREAISTDLDTDPVYGDTLINTYHTDIATDPFFALGSGLFGLFLDRSSYTATIQRKTGIRYMCFSKK